MTTTSARVTPGWSWRVPATRELALTTVPVPAGGTLWVDAFDPSRVVAFHAPTPAALGSLAATLGQDWLERTLRTLGPGGASDDDALAPDTLPDAWQRVALLHALRQWSPAPLDESLLDIDESIAWSDAGVEAWADAVAASDAYRILDLVRRLHDGGLPAATHDAIEDAAALAVRALPDGDERRRSLIEAEATMADATALDPAELTTVLDGWSVDSHREAALTLRGGTGEGARERSAVQVLVDPLAVHTRVIAWAGPNQPVISARVTDGSVEIRVTLGTGFDAATTEALGLVVFAVEPRTGRILASAPVHGDGETEVVGSLDLEPAGPVTLVGVCDASALERVRTDRAGRSAALAEQHLLAAWSATRLAHAGRGSLSSAADALRTADERAVDARDPLAFDRSLSRVRRLLHDGPPVGVSAPLLAERLVGVLDDDPA